MRESEGYLNARQAAAYVGYEPKPAGTKGPDTELRAFYAWVRRNHVEVYARDRSGGARFKRRDLDRVIERNTAAHREAGETRLERMARLGRAHARGEDGRSVM